MKTLWERMNIDSKIRLNISAKTEPNCCAKIEEFLKSKNSYLELTIGDIIDLSAFASSKMMIEISEIHEMFNKE
jgi:hypothetical protein